LEIIKAGGERVSEKGLTGGLTGIGVQQKNHMTYHYDFFTGKKRVGCENSVKKIYSACIP